MPKLLQATVLVAVFALLGGCCRDTIREMASLKDTPLAEKAPDRHRSAKHRASNSASEGAAQGAAKSAKLDRDDDDDDDRGIETGSVKKPDCQGQHLAYQATKEYLKNFGPKPPDQPGERGPCNAQ